MAVVARAPGGFVGVSLLGALALACLSLLLPFEPVFDAWAWLIWGRELADLELDTSAGASWKPLPALVATPLSALGDAAPELWLIVARTGWLAAPALAARLAWRLAGEAGCGRRAALAAGVVAGLALLLLYDAFTPWLRQFAGGLSEPLLVTLALGAIEAHLAARARLAFALLLGAALLRPESWPFLIGYGLHRWRRGAPAEPIALALFAVPLLWLVPDLLGAGDALAGAERARADQEGPLTNGLEALWRGLLLAPAGIVAAAAAWVWIDRRAQGAATARLLAALAAGWVAIVVAMALFGFAGLPRFSAPAGALACALGGAGLVVLAARRGVARGLAAACALALLVQGSFRVAELPDQVREASAQHRELDRMRGLLAEVGPGVIARCRRVSTSDLLTQSALAWELERPVAGVELNRDSLPARGLALVGPDARPGALAAAAAPEREAVARRHGWRAYAISCSDRGSEGSNGSASGVGGRR